MLNHSANPGRETLAIRKDDLYETPEVAVRALLRAENIPQRVWEPACGPGSIVRVLRESGREVYATDLVDYDCPGARSRIDFLMERDPADVDAIITNPPFKLAEEFIRHALYLCPNVIMLLRLAFLESARRTDILEKSGLRRVHVFRERLPMMNRGGWQGPQGASSICFAWFVWDRCYRGPTELRRISWKDIA